jgi:Protein of unknown function (DUF3489)
MTPKPVRRKAIVIPITAGRRPAELAAPVLPGAGSGRHLFELRARVALSTRPDAGRDRIDEPGAYDLKPCVFLPPDHPLAGDLNPMRYVITEDNKVRAWPIGAPRPKDAALFFGRHADLSKRASRWPMQRLVSVWNQLPGTRAVTRFENRAVAVDRIWGTIERIRERLVAIESAPGRKPAARETKADLIVRMLRERSGATITALTKATGWQPHSVRGFMSARLSKDLGLTIQSAVRNGERIYRIRGRSNAN